MSSQKFILSPRLRFTFKVGLAAGAVYFVSEQGVWRDSVETTKLCSKITENISPYLDQAKSHVPVELPQLPSRNQLSYILKQSWNKGVLMTFQFLGNLPEHVSTWTEKGVNAVKSNEDIKKFIESFSGSTETSQSTKN